MYFKVTAYVFKHIITNKIEQYGAFVIDFAGHCNSRNLKKKKQCSRTNMTCHAEIYSFGNRGKVMHVVMMMMIHLLYT